MNRNTLIYPDNSRYIRGETRELVNKQEVLENANAILDELKMSRSSVMFGLFIGMVFLLSGLGVVSYYMLNMVINFDADLFIQRAGNVLIGFVGIAAGVVLLLGTFNILRLMRMRNNPDLIYATLVNEGRITLGKAITVEHGANTIIQYEFNRRGKRIKSTYITNAKVDVQPQSNLMVLDVGLINIVL